MVERVFPGIVANEEFLREQLDMWPGDVHVGGPRTLPTLALEGWGRSGSLFTRDRSRGGFYFVRCYGIDAEGWAQSWDARVQTSAVVSQANELVRGGGKPPATSPMVDLAPETGGRGFVLSVAASIAAALIWRFLK